MSESGGEKRFDATPARIAKARREGNSARSQELSSTAAFACAGCSILTVAAPIGALARAAITEASRGKMPLASVAAMLAFALVPAVAAAAGGAVASIAQSGGIHIASVGLKFERLNPAESLKRMCSRETAMHAVRAGAAFAVAACAVFPVMRDVFATLAGDGTPQRVALVAWSGAQRVVFAASAVGGAFAIAEYGVARRAWLQKLKMSLEDLKRDMKESDGDPAARGRRKAMHRNMLRGAAAQVKDASFVVVNPTHVAVALDYRPPDVPVPVVLVCAADEAALRVRAIAERHGIPVVENVAVARALFRDASAGKPIPHSHYVAIAEVVVALIRSGALEARS